MKAALPDTECDELGGTFLGLEHFDVLVDEDLDVYTEDGRALVKYRANAISTKETKAAYPALLKAAVSTDNRGMAGGIATLDRVDRSKVAHADGGVRYSRLKRDGTVSKTNQAVSVNSGIVGYFDRNPRFPYCRQTAFNIHNAELFAQALPYFREVDSVFREEMPEEYEFQRAVVEQTDPHYVIGDTAFTTITVNRNFRTACHKDAGDLKGGFGVLTCHRAGVYTGGFLCFPKYRVAVNLATRAVLLADVHQWHGNTEIRGRAGAYERITCVFYYREGMKYCGSPEQELELAKTRQRGEALKTRRPGESHTEPTE